MNTCCSRVTVAACVGITAQCRRRREVNSLAEPRCTALPRYILHSCAALHSQLRIRSAAALAVQSSSPARPAALQTFAIRAATNFLLGQVFEYTNNYK